jgi:hypothetical protein
MVNTRDRKHRNAKPLIKSVDEMLLSGVQHSNGSNKYYIPMVSPVEYTEQDLPLDPYLFGILLGDGHLAGESVKFSSADAYIVSEISKRIPESLMIRRINKYDYVIRRKDLTKFCRNPIITALRTLGVYGHKSYTKFIPDVYRYNSVDNRLALLQGLMDSDGYTSGTSSEFSTSSKQLAEDVQDLIWSLGGRTHLKERATIYTYNGEKKKGQLSYRLHLSLPNHICPFKLPRKVNAYTVKTKYSPTRAITKIEYVGEEYAQCISVNSKRHLYVTDDYIVTHNTQGAIALLKRLQSEKERPVKAVFFAPSIKLCHALSASLSHAGVENTLYIEGGRRTKDKETLKRAQVLVTTLQTFAVKVFLSVKASAYDLVVMDECDELLSAFVRSGINGKVAAPSHVDKTQSRLGVEALQALLRDAGQVLMLDGTMTELSRYIMYAWAGHKQIGVYENTYNRDKAPVTLYGTLQTLRDDLVNSVKEGKRVVVACDTKAEAQRIETLLLLTESVTKDKVLRITGDTAADERVNHFFRNVEEGAKAYPVIIYNSAMGSGVSITEVTPDIVYLFGTYLTPRKLLQMLNRYRSQGEVRAYVQSSETLYSLSVADRYVQLTEAAKVEEILAGIERLERDDLATIVTNAALIVATDEYEQTRSVREFFTRLILDDGREVKHHWTTTAIYEEESKQVQALIKEAKEDTCRTWRSVPPIKRGDPFPQGISAEDAARGLLHGYITEIFDNLEGSTLEDAEIARLALSFGRRRSVIKRWIDPESIMTNVIDELQNTRKESVTYRLYLARIELITQLYILFPDTEDKYNDSDQIERAKRFIEEVKRRQAVYDLIAPYEYRFEAINRSDKTEVEKAIALARQVLKQIGLSIKRDNGKRMEGKRDRRSRIDGTADLNNFLTLSGLSNVDAVRDFNYSRFTASMADARSAAERFNKMKPAAKREVLKDMEALSASQSIPFSTLIDIQESRSFAV